jgi:hypothetical protein
MIESFHFLGKVFFKFTQKTENFQKTFVTTMQKFAKRKHFGANMSNNEFDPGSMFTGWVHIWNNTQH